MSIKLDQAGVYTDFKGIADLKNQADKNSPAALEAVARQFEALFIQQIFKSMRDAQLGEGLFESDESDFYKDLLDKQLSINLAQNSGLGLAQLIARQLQQTGLVASEEKPTPEVKTGFDVLQSKTPANTSLESNSVTENIVVPLRDQPGSVSKENQSNDAPDAITVVSSENQSNNADSDITPIGLTEQNTPQFASPQSFIATLWPLAQRAAQVLGVEPETLLAQAALETGWGKRILRKSNGDSSHNLFNIKAGADWKGARLSLNALEYTPAGLQQELSSFKSYASYDESFADYISLLQTNPRYALVSGSTSAMEFTNNLQSAGYATDPQYASKIMQIVEGPLLQQALRDAE